MSELSLEGFSSTPAVGVDVGWREVLGEAAVSFATSSAEGRIGAGVASAGRAAVRFVVWRYLRWWEHGLPHHLVELQTGQIWLPIMAGRGLYANRVRLVGL